MLSDSNESVPATGRANDTSGASVVSSNLAEAALLCGIGKFKMVSSVSLQEVLNDDENAQVTIFCLWTPFLTTLRLAAGSLALVNVFTLVADPKHAIKYLLIGLLVLLYQGVKTKFLLNECCDLSDGANCSHIESSSTSEGQVRQVIIARLNCFPNFGVGPTTVWDNSCPLVNYYDFRSKQDPFPDSSFLDSPYSAQPGAVEDKDTQMVQVAVFNGLSAG